MTDAFQPIQPNSREEWLEFRKSTIGASEASALLGVHPWLTPYRLFMAKTGQYNEERAETKVHENSIHMPPLERGNFMESKAFEALRLLRPTWALTPNQIPGGAIFFDRELSSTPDAFLAAPDRPGTGALQVKTVAPMVFDREWKNEDGEIEFPVYVAVQAIVDATLSGCDWACAGAMVNNFGVDFYLIDVPLTPGLMNRIRTEAGYFWRRVRENNPYPPDYGRDSDIIKSIFADDDGGEIDLSGNERVSILLARRDIMKTREIDGDLCARARKEIDAELIHLLGNAARGTLGDGRLIEAKTVRRGGYAVEPTTFRSIKIKRQRKIA